MPVPDRLRVAVDAACNGTLPDGEVLTFDHIIEVAEKFATERGYVRFSDYDVDLLTEVLNGHCGASSVGFRLFLIRYALKQKGWSPEGRPVRFYPPRRA